MVLISGKIPSGTGLRNAAIIERRSGPWWNAISSATRRIVPALTNPAIKRGDVVSALLITRDLENFPDAFFPRKWKGHSIDPFPVSSLNMGSQGPGEFQFKKRLVVAAFHSSRSPTSASLSTPRNLPFLFEQGMEKSPSFSEEQGLGIIQHLLGKNEAVCYP